MRFMMLVIPEDYEKAKADAVPSADAVAAMTKYNESLEKAGVLLSLDGLHPPASGSRVIFGQGKLRIVDGPFTESKEMIGGYWIIQVKSKAEALEWASRVPAAAGGIRMIEVRQIFEMSEFPPDVQDAAKRAATA